MPNHYPDCQLHHMEQRSDAWWEVRKGLLTASEFGAWVIDKKGGKVATRAKKSAICKLLAQAAGCPEPPSFDNWTTERGSELEPLAIECFENATGLTVAPVGFCKSVHGKFGCSPDGLIMSNGEGIESKAPLPATHCKYVLEGELPAEYKLQVHGSMAVTGAPAWWFQSFCPGLPPLTPQSGEGRPSGRNERGANQLLQRLRQNTASPSRQVGRMEQNSSMSRPNKAEIEGEVINIGEVENFASGFSKRILVVKTDDDKYPQEIPIEFVKDKAQKLDALSVGDHVTVPVDIRGNEHNGKWYLNLTGWRVEGLDGREVTKKQSTPQSEAEDDQIPY
jgi:hypothetical protein